MKKSYSRQEVTQRMERKTILVIEDEIPLLDAIKKKLENNGIDVVTARSVEQALTYLNDIEKIDGIWLDHYLLGQSDGLALVSVLKQESSKWKHIPIFVVSNTASEDKVRTYMQLGVDKYFVKANFRLDQIIAALKESLNGTQ